MDGDERNEKWILTNVCWETKINLHFDFADHFRLEWNISLGDNILNIPEKLSQYDRCPFIAGALSGGRSNTVLRKCPLISVLWREILLCSKSCYQLAPEYHRQGPHFRQKSIRENCEKNSVHGKIREFEYCWLKISGNIVRKILCREKSGNLNIVDLKYQGKIIEF